MAQIVTTVESGSHAVCTLNLPEKRNPISKEMRDALVEALEALRQKSHVRAIIITGAGTAFCSGLDLAALASQAQRKAAEHLADSQSISDFLRYVATYPKPTIAAVNGPAVAGGCGLALVCDLTIASSEASFCFSEVKIGFVPAIVGIYLQRAVGSKTARDLLLTARKLPADEALLLGLISKVVPGTDLLRHAAEIADQIAKNSPVAIAMTKSLLIRSENISLEESLRLAVEINAQARTTEDCKEGVKAFLEKRLPQF